MKKTDKLLSKEIGKLSTWSWSPIARLSGYAGGYLGASIVPTDVKEDKIETKESAMSCIEIAYQTLSSSGKILDDFDNESNTPALTSMQKSGFMNLNPVLVSIHFTPTESGTELHIQAYAKEGLIKQNSAMKCIATLKERITSQLKEF